MGRFHPEMWPDPLLVDIATLRGQQPRPPSAGHRIHRWQGHGRRARRPRCRHRTEVTATNPHHIPPSNPDTRRPWSRSCPWAPPRPGTITAMPTANPPGTRRRSPAATPLPITNEAVAQQHWAELAGLRGHLRGPRWRADRARPWRGWSASPLACCAGPADGARMWGARLLRCMRPPSTSVCQESTSTGVTRLGCDSTYRSANAPLAGGPAPHLA